MRAHGGAQIVITRGRFRPGELSDADLLARARFTGACTANPESGLGVSGHGLRWYLGDADGLGDLYEAAAFTINKTFEDALDTSVLGSGRGQGLTKGTVPSGGSTHKMEIAPGTTARDVLGFYCDARNYRHVINPDGSIDADTRANLYDTAQVLFSSQPGGREGNINAVNAELVVSETDIDDVNDKVITSWESGGFGGFQTATNTLPDTMIGFDGSALRHERYIDTQSKAKDATVAGNIATAQAGRFDQARQKITVRFDLFDPWRIMRPGDWVYTWDPKQGLVDLDNQVQFRGELVFPMSIRTDGWQVPIVDGLGVMLRHGDGDGGLEYFDLTDHVEFEDGPITVDVGSKNRELIEPELI